MGTITITDAAGLQQAACSCYGIVKAEFDLITGNGQPSRGAREDEPDLPRAIAADLIRICLNHLIQASHKAAANAKRCMIALTMF